MKTVFTLCTLALISLTLSGCFGSKTVCIDMQKTAVEKASLKIDLTNKLKYDYIQAHYQQHTDKAINEDDAAVLYDKVKLINQTYGNSNEFGVVCSTAVPTLKHSSSNLFDKKKVSKKQFCYQNPDVTIANLGKEAEDAALKAIFSTYASDLSDISGDDAEHLMLSYDASNGHLDLKNKKYCFDYKTTYFIADVEIFRLKRNVSPAQIQKVKKGKSLHSGSFILDLSGSSVGDLPKDLGDGIVIKSGSEGKGIGTYLNSSTIVFKRPLSENYKIHMMMYNQYEENNSYITAALHYDQYITDSIHLDLSNSGQGTKATYRMGKELSQKGQWNGAVNVNEIVIEKHKNSLKYFFNGDYKFTFNTKGKKLNAIEIPIGKNDLLYQLNATDLNESEEPFKLAP